MAQQYTVKPGDTLETIATSMYNDPAMADILKTTGITSLLPGQQIDIPDMPTTQPPASTSLTPTPTGSLGPTQNAIAQALPGTTAVPAPNAGLPTTPTAPQTPLEAMPLAPTPPEQPNYPRPEMKGGEQTFTLFNNMVSGNLPMPKPTELKTPAEQEAFRMYQNYQKYKSVDSKTLYDAIQKGDITPDPNNVLWRAIGGGTGEPTPAMVEAYGWWKLAQERNASQRRPGDPFLGGQFPKPKNLAEANALLNEDQTNIVTGKGGDTTGAVVNESVTDTSLTTEQYDEFYNELVTMVDLKGPGAPEYEKSLMALRGQYDVTRLEGELDLLQKEYRDMEAITRQRLQYQTDQPVAMNVIAGRMSEVERQQKERLDYLGREIKYRADMISTANNAIEGIMKAKQLDYGVAREQWQDQVKAAQGFLDGFNTMRKNEMDAQAQMRQDAQANLTAFYNLITEGTLDSKTLSASQQGQIARLEAMSGMPVGTFMDLGSKYPSKEVKGNTERYGPDGTKYIDFVMQDRKTGAPSIVTIKAGYDASKAISIASDQLGLIEKGLDITGKSIDNRLKEDQLLFDRPLDRESKRLAMANTQSTLTGKDLENQQKYREIYGGQVASGDDYFSNLGAITGPNGSAKWSWGLDVDVKKGDPVPSPVSGTVIATKENGGFGKQVQIKGDDGNTYWLSHFDGYVANVGDKVTAGQIVGIGGNTGDVYSESGGDGSHVDITIFKPDGSKMTAPQVQQHIRNTYSKQYTGQAAAPTQQTSESLDIYDKNGAVDEKKFTTYVSKSLNTVIGGDGFLSEEDYDYGKKNWVQMGLDPKDYDERFKQYVNPKFYTSYNLDDPEKLSSYFLNRSDTQMRKDQQKISEAWSSNLGTKTMDYINRIVE